MTLHAEFLFCLERIRNIEAQVTGEQLRGCAQGFVTQRWVLREGYQTSILVPVLGVEEEVDVSVNTEHGTYSYRSPAQPNRCLTRSLDEIATYAWNVDAWLDSLAQVLEIENAQRPKHREVISGHLWHVGNLRAGNTHRFVPIYVARRLNPWPEDWRRALVDAQRPSHGVVLVAGELDASLPNGHQPCRIDALLIAGADTVTLDPGVMTRLLRGMPADAIDPVAWFEDRTGELKLHQMTTPKVFSGAKQKAVIAAFWRDRHEPSLKWSEVVGRTGCGRDPDSVFGKQVWREWLESAGHGHYRLRTREARRPS